MLIVADQPDIRSRLDAGYRAGSSELALRKHGLDGQQMLALANAAAEAGLKQMRPPPPLDHGERQDLVAFILEAGLRWALVYDIDKDARRNFATSVYSRMRRRVTDWCRTNIHDARFGTDKRHTAIDTANWSESSPELRASPWAHESADEGDAWKHHRVERHGVPTTPWGDTTRDAFIEPDFQDLAVSRVNVDLWRTLAAQAGLPLVDFLDAAVNYYAQSLEAAA